MTFVVYEILMYMHLAWFTVALGRVHFCLPGCPVVKNLPADAGDAGDIGSFPGWEAPLEEEMATFSSILAWEVPWTEEPGRLQSMELQRVGHD